MPPSPPPSVKQKLQTYPLQESSSLDDKVYYRRRNYPLKDIPAPPAIIGDQTDLIQDQNCAAINFGWPEELTIPSISLSLGLTDHNEIEVIRSSIPSNCLIVMIGGRYLSRVNDIVRKVETVSEHLPLKPKAYFGEKTDAKIPEETSTALVKS